MEKIHTTHSGFLPYDNLSTEAKRLNILPKLQSASLVSLGQLCDDDCEVNLNKKFLHVIKGKKEIIKGYRNSTDGLWDIPIPVYLKSPKKQHASVIIQKQTNKKDLIQFYHAACFSPTIATFLKAVKNGNFISWPGLTPNLINKFLKPTVAAHFGHLKKIDKMCKVHNN